jgi:phosphoglycolate phosphatase-like HAD superfamily hydrolase
VTDLDRHPSAGSAPGLAISAVVFDLFETLLQIGDRRSSYRLVVQWMRDSGRRPMPDDAARLMTRPVPLSSVGTLFSVTLPADLLDTAQRALDDEINSLRLFPDTVTTVTRLRDAGVRVGICSNRSAASGRPLSRPGGRQNCSALFRNTCVAQGTDRVAVKNLQRFHPFSL